MPEERLDFVLRAVDETTKVLLSIDKRLEQVGEESRKTNDKFKGFGESTTILLTLDAAMGVVTKSFSAARGAFNALFDVVTIGVRQFEALADVSFDLVREYEAVAKANTTLESVLKATGNLTAENTKRWTDLAESLKDVALTGSEDILPLITRLGAFSGFNDNLERASRAATDLSAAFGISLESSFSKFIKAVNSGNLELAEGVSVQLAATDQAGRLGEAIDFVNQKFGGTAQAIAKGGASALRQLEVTLQATRQKLGEVIADSPFFQAFVGAVKTSLEEVIDFLDANKENLGKSFGEAFKVSLDLALATVQQIAFTFSQIAQSIVGVARFFNLIPDVEGLTAQQEKLTRSIEASVQALRQRGIALQDTGPFQELQAPSSSEIRQALASGEATGSPAEIEGIVRRLQEYRTELEETERTLIRLREQEGLGVTIETNLDLVQQTFEGLFGDFDNKIENNLDALAAERAATEQGATQIADTLTRLNRRSTEQSAEVKTLIEAINKSTPAITEAGDGIEKSAELLKDSAEILSKEVAISGLAGDGVTQQAGFQAGGSLAGLGGASSEELAGVFGELVNATETGLNEAFDKAVAIFEAGGVSFEGSVAQALTDQAETKRLQEEAVQAASDAEKEAATAIEEAGVSLDEVSAGVEQRAEGVFQGAQANIDGDAVNIESFASATDVYGEASDELLAASGQWGEIGTKQQENLTAEARVTSDFARAVERFSEVLAVFGNTGGPRFAQHGAILSRPTLIAGEAGTEVIAPTGARGSALLQQALGLTQANALRNGGIGGMSLSIHANNVTMNSDGGAAFAAAFERRMTQGLLRRSRLGT